jgi:TonB family protein
MGLAKFSLIFLVAAVQLAMATSSMPSVSASLAVRERELWLSTQRDSEYAAMPSSAARAACVANESPQALATPVPLLDQPEWNRKVTVSFIIGTDGRVHSPLILESAGPSEDKVVLKAVRSWRYRPATCNGVPTEVEAKIGFSNR